MSIEWEELFQMCWKILESLMQIILRCQKEDVFGLHKLVCLSVSLSALSGSPYQPNGESFHCSETTHIPRNGKGRLNRDSDLIVPDPPVVTSNAGIPEMRGRRKQGWALSKRGSQCPGAGAS